MQITAWCHKNSAFAVRAQAAGNTLFLFLCREANEDIDAHEYVARLDRAINDIEHRGRRRG